MDQQPQTPWPARLREALASLAGGDTAFNGATVLLHGSTTAGVDDAVSDLDVWVLPPTDHAPKFIEFKLDGKPGHFNIESRCDFEARVRRCYLPLIYELRRAIPLQADDDWGERLQSLARQPMSAAVRAGWFAYHYIEMRGEHRACDNPIYRNDAVALLLALQPTLAHALQAAMVLDSEPYPYSKWLPTSAATTPTGRAIAPLVADVIDLLGTGVLRQGPAEQHPLDVKLKQIRQQLIDAARHAGLDGPWLKEWYLHLDLRNRIHELTWEPA